MFDRKKYKRDAWAQSAGLPSKMLGVTVVTAAILLVLYAAICIPQWRKMGSSWQNVAAASDGTDVFPAVSDEQWDDDDDLAWDEEWDADEEWYDDEEIGDDDVVFSFDTFRELATQSPDSFPEGASDWTDEEWEAYVTDILSNDDYDYEDDDESTLVRKRLLPTYNYFSPENRADMIRSLLLSMLLFFMVNIIGFACSRYVYQYRKTGDASFGAYVASYSPKLVLASLWYCLWRWIWMLPASVGIIAVGSYVTKISASASAGDVNVFMAVFVTFVIEAVLFIYMVFAMAKIISYILMCYVLAENPAIGVRKAMTLSKKMSKGARENIFAMEVSFWLWWAFVFVTLGFGLILFLPYLENSWINAYEAVKKNALETGVLTEGDFDVLQ